MGLYQCFKNWIGLDCQTGPVSSIEPPSHWICHKLFEPTVKLKNQTNHSILEELNGQYPLPTLFIIQAHLPCLWIFGKRSSPLYGPHPTLNQLMGCILSPHDVDMPLAWLPM